MQSTEDEARTPETIIHEAETAIWKDSEYFTAEDVFVLAKALAAERDRADSAEARLNKVRQYAEDRSIHHRARKDSVVGSWRIASDLLSILDSDATA